MCSYLFWTEWGQYPRIERSRLDGSQRLVLVNVSISWPNGISIDYEVRTAAFTRPLKPPRTKRYVKRKADTGCWSGFFAEFLLFLAEF